MDYEATVVLEEGYLDKPPSPQRRETNVDRSPAQIIVGLFGADSDPDGDSADATERSGEQQKPEDPLLKPGWFSRR